MSEELKFSQNFTSYLPKEQKVYPIQEHDWNKLKVMLNNCNQTRTWTYKDVGLLLLGSASSAFLSLLALYSSENMAPWVLNLNWIVLICTLVIGIILFFIDDGVVKRDRATVQQVVEEMFLIEGKYQIPDQSSIEIPDALKK